MRQALLYSIKVWLTTVLVAPALCNILQYGFLSLVNHNSYMILSWRRIAFILLSPMYRVGVYLAVYAVLALVFLLTTWLLNKSHASMKRYKLYFSIDALVYLLAPYLWYILSYHTYTGNEVIRVVVSLVCNVVVVLPCVWLYKLKPLPTEPQSETSKA
jgi:hypothetical protein